MSRYKLSTHSKSVRRAIQALGVDHDSEVKKWKQDLEADSASPKFQIIGDNLDVGCKTKHQTVLHKNKDQHYFNLLAVKDKVSGSHLSDFHERNLNEVELHEFITSKEDLNVLRENFIVLISRILAKRLPKLRKLRKCIIFHIWHGP